MRLDRRKFLTRAGGLTAAGWLGTHWLGATREALARTAGTVASGVGTTLERTLVLGPTLGAGPYRRLTEGPGAPLVVRAQGAEPKAGREERRVPLACIVHLTDVHVVDAESPARVEFLDRYSDPPGSSPFGSAFRPQEPLTAHVAEAMVRQLAAIGAGPVTGRPFDCAVTTGDVVDNQQENEVEWAFALLDGGPVAPASGGDAYEGVQDQDQLTYDAHYWHPEDERPAGDQYKQFVGFPSYPGLLAAAALPFTATGLAPLGLRWFSAYGNHDGLAQGNGPDNAVFDAIATGSVKVVNVPAGLSPADVSNGLAAGDPTVLAALATGPGRPVTPDPKRRALTHREWVQAHLDRPAVPGPKGHGYTEEHLESGDLHYTFPVAPGVLGVCLDTVNRGGYSEGSIGAAQLAWLEQQIQSASTRWFDSSGAPQRGAGPDQLVVLFSHHSLNSMSNPVPDPERPDDARLMAEEVLAVLWRYPNVVLWVNGHSHENAVRPRPDPQARTAGFWEILSSAHIDWPQQSRIVELTDNRDGTMSVFAVVVDHAGPAVAAGDGGGRGLLDLAAISRELSANDPQVDLGVALGAPESRNVELLLPAPFDLSVLGSASPAVPAMPAPPELPATGGAAATTLGAAAAALGAAVAFRTRRDRAQPGEDARSQPEDAGLR